MNILKKREKQIRKKNRVQFYLKKVNAYNDRLRVAVYLSARHASIQLISADGKQTLAHVSTQQQWFKDNNQENKEVKSYNVPGCTTVGIKMAEILKKDFQGKLFYFDRGGREYGKIVKSDSKEDNPKIIIGRVKAIAEAIRQQGILL